MKIWLLLLHVFVKRNVIQTYNFLVHVSLLRNTAIHARFIWEKRTTSKNKSIKLRIKMKFFYSKKKQLRRRGEERYEKRIK